MLAKGDDQQLAALAAKEAAGASKPQDAAALADSYLDIANTKLRSALVRSGAAARAVWWYGQVLPHADESSKNAIQKRIDEALQLAIWMPRPIAIDSLRTALLWSKWSWGEPGVQMTFKDDDTVSHRGMHGRWRIASPRLVILTISNGDTMYLRFNASLTTYVSLGRGFGGDRFTSPG